MAATLSEVGRLTRPQEVWAARSRCRVCPGAASRQGKMDIPVRHELGRTRNSLRIVDATECGFCHTSRPRRSSSWL